MTIPIDYSADAAELRNYFDLLNDFNLKVCVEGRKANGVLKYTEPTLSLEKAIDDGAKFASARLVLPLAANQLTAVESWGTHRAKYSPFGQSLEMTTENSNVAFFFDPASGGLKSPLEIEGLLWLYGGHEKHYPLYPLTRIPDRIRGLPDVFDEFIKARTGLTFGLRFVFSNL